MAIIDPKTGQDVKKPTITQAIKAHEEHLKLIGGIVNQAQLNIHIITALIERLYEHAKLDIDAHMDEILTELGIKKKAEEKEEE